MARGRSNTKANFQNEDFMTSVSVNIIICSIAIVWHYYIIKAEKKMIFFTACLFAVSMSNYFFLEKNKNESNSFILEESNTEYEDKEKEALTLIVPSYTTRTISGDITPQSSLSWN